uniref:Uncharacterized protein n=1 Tax=Anguilla anguilla TaxID=7936 RepID=A0A0E9QWX5_ANGAN
MGKCSTDSTRKSETVWTVADN